MNIGSRLTWVRPFLVLVLVITVPLVVYWFGYVDGSIRAALRQSHTTVAAVATSLEDRLRALDQVARTAEDLPPGKDRSAYLLSLVSAGRARSPGETHHLRLADDERGLLLSVSDPNGALTSVSVKLENLIPWDIVEAEFDGLVVLSAAGRLLAQDRRLPSQARGLPFRVTRSGAPVDLRGFFNDGSETGPAAAASRSSQPATGDGTGGSTTAAGGDSRWKLPTDFSSNESITIAGTRYVAFLQPVRLYTSPIEGRPGSDGAAEQGTVDVLVAGLVAEERLRRQSRSLSPQTLSNVLAVVGLGLFLIPFLKLRFIGARERMRYRDVFTMVVALLGMTAVVVLFMLDGSATTTLRTGFDAGLQRLHAEIADRAGREASEAIRQLEDATRLPTYCSALGLGPGEESAGAGAPATPCSIATSVPVAGESEGGILLSDCVPGEHAPGGCAIGYPVLDTIFIADARSKPQGSGAGQQTFKWSPRTMPTGNVNVGSRSYFRDALALPADGTEPSGAGVGPPAAAREFVVSMASGQEQMAFALPVDGVSGRIGASVPPERRTHVAALTSPMRSLARTVVPSPYEFVMVGRDGRVTFRNARSAYLGERFFEQLRGGAVLATVPRDGSTIPGDFSYRWRNIRAVASDVPALQMTLVTFYDTETARELAARAFGTAAAFTLAAILSTVIGALLAAFVWGRHAHDWLWPDSEDTGRYVVGSAVCVVAVLALVAVRPVLIESPGWFAIGVLIIPGLVTVLCGSPLWFRTRLLWQIGDADSRPVLHKAAFCGFLLSMLLALVATPAVLAFDDALRLYATGYQRVSALQWWRDLERAARGFDSEYAEVRTAAGEPRDSTGCGAPGRICANTVHFEELTGSLIDPFDVTAAGSTIGSGREWDLYRGCPSATARNEEQRGAAARLDADGTTPAGLVADTAPHPSVDDCSLALNSIGATLPWSFTTFLSRTLARLGEAGPAFARVLAADGVTHQKPVWPLSAWSWNRWTLLWVFGGLALLVFIVHSVAVHILGLGWRNQRLLDAAARVEPGDGKRWLVLRPTRSCLERLKAHTTQVVDLRHATASSPLVAPLAGQTLLVRNVEAALRDESLRKALLALVSSPSAGCLILCSEIDPLYYLSQRVRESADARIDAMAGTEEAKAASRANRVELQSQQAAWAAALSDFQKARVRAPAFPKLDEALPHPVRALLYRECRHSEPLIEIAERLARSPDLAKHREDEIVGFVLDAAEPYYRSIWELCSDDERLLLVQLAEEGVINPKRFDVFRQLHHRGLVVVEPRFDLMNHSFRDFVRSIESPERVLEWEQTPAALGWRRFSTPLYTLAAVVVAILLYTQQDLFSQMLALATGAAGALNSLRSLGIMANAQNRPATTKTANV